MISEECNDNWVNMAMADDTIVANLLLSLNNNNNNNENNNDSPSLQNLHWTVRKRRTTWHTPNTATVAAKKTESAARASPTTPLSWSAATSASGAADGSEDSSRPTNKPIVAVDASRSKVDSQSETAAAAAAAAANKRRKKRTLSELHEEEELLLKERNDLKDELASLQLTVDKHRATNRNLKRIKLTLASRGKTSKTTTKTAATSPVAAKAFLDTPQLVEAQEPVTAEAVLDTPQVVEAQGNHHHPSESELVSPPQTVQEKVPDAAASPVCEASTSSPKQQETSEQRPNFVLPDLNLPLEEEFNSNVVPDIS